MKVLKIARETEINYSLSVFMFIIHTFHKRQSTVDSTDKTVNDDDAQVEVTQKFSQKFNNVDSFLL